MRKNVTEYLDITEGLYSEKIAVEDAMVVSHLVK